MLTNLVFRRGWRFFTFTAAAVIVVAAVALSLRSGGATPGGRSRQTAYTISHSVPRRLLTTHRFAKDLRARFQILHEAHRASVTIPSVFNSFIDRSEQQLGLDAAAAAEVTPAAGVTMWFVPGESGYCLLIVSSNAADNGGACGPTSANDLGFALIKGTRTTRTLFGFAPDGNSTVSVRLADGNSVAVPVVDNAYDLTEPRTDSPETVVGVGLAGTSATVSIGRTPAIPANP